MGHFRATILATCAVVASSAAAQDSATGGQTVLQGPKPSWAVVSEPLAVPTVAGGLGFMRVQDTQVHLDASGQQTFTAQRIKLLHPQALQIGNIAIAWNPAVGAPTIHSLRILRGDQAIDVLETAKFEVIRREDQLEQAMLSGILTAVLKVPDLRVGDELEWLYTVPSGDPTLEDRNAGALGLTGSTLPGRYRLALSWEDGQQPQIKATDDFGAPVTRSAKGLEIRVDNPATLAPPKDAPPRYFWQRIIEYSDFPSWTAISSQFGGLFAEASRLKADSPLKQEAARIAAAHATPEERAQAALALVQDQVRYIYVGLDGGNFRPATADETWQRRYGDCKGKTALLLALLSELGITARPVLVQNGGVDDGYDARLPSPNLFDHVLVQADIGGTTYWLDGTLPAVAEMRPAPFLPYRSVLPLTPGGAGLVKLAATPAQLPQEMGLFEIDARQGFAKPARKVYTTVKRGLPGLAEYMSFSALTGEQLKTGLRSALAGDGEWDSLDDVAYRYDRKTQASILTLTGTGRVEWDSYGEGAYQLSLPGGGFSPPDRRQRPAEQDQAAPYFAEPEYSCHATTVRLPEGTDLKNWGFNSVFDTMMYGRLYYRMMERRDDRTIRMVRGSRVERPEITAEAAKRDNERLERFDNSKANIAFDPAEAAEAWGDLTPVPATYEFDWTGPNAPCLPKDVISRKAG